MHMIALIVAMAIVVVAVMLLAYTIDTKILVLVPVAVFAAAVGAGVDSVLDDVRAGGYDCHGGDIYVLEDAAYTEHGDVVPPDDEVYPLDSWDPDTTPTIDLAREDATDAVIEELTVGDDSFGDVDAVDSVRGARMGDADTAASTRVNGGVPPPVWLTDDIDGFRAVFKGARSGLKYERTVVAMLNRYVRAGEFTDQAPDWLVVTDDDIGAVGSGARKTVPLSIDGYNSALGVCFEYQGPIHYEYTLGGEESTRNPVYAEWVRSRQNDFIKDALVREHGLKMLKISYNCVTADRTRDADGYGITRGTAERYARYVLSRLAELGALRPGLVGGAADPAGQISALQSMTLWARAVGEPSRKYNTNEIKRIKVNRADHVAINSVAVERANARRARAVAIEERRKRQAEAAVARGL